MSQKNHIVGVALNQSALDWQGNFLNIKNVLLHIQKELKKKPSTFIDLVVFPELCVSSYGCEDAFLFRDTSAKSLEITKKIAKFAHTILPKTTVIVGLPFFCEEDSKLYNTCAVLCNGYIEGLTAKQQLAYGGLHYENRWFHPFPKDLAAKKICIDKREILLGPQLYLSKSQQCFIIEICEDTWVAQEHRPSFIHKNLQKNGQYYNLIISPNASHFTFDKYKKRREIALNSTQESNSSFFMVNSLGFDGTASIYDGHCLYSKMLIDDSALRNQVSIHEKYDFSFMPFQCYFFPIASPPTKNNVPYTKETTQIGMNNHIDEEPKLPIYKKEILFIKALTLGLADYFRKSKSKSFVISLSGGADSSTCLLLIQRMFLYIIAELDLDKALKHLALHNHAFFSPSELKKYTQKITRAKQIYNKEPTEKNRNNYLASLESSCQIILPKTVHTIYQKTQNNSKETSTAAERIAQALHSNHIDISIDSQVHNYLSLIEPHTGKLQWEKNNVVLQNVQARTRVVLPWILANLHEGLLIATNNRSEIATGYTTVDGDSCGGLSLIGGIDKAFIQKWLHFMEKDGDEFGRVASLEYINRLKPSAELKPLHNGKQHQFDEEELMPFEILEKIQKCFIVKHMNRQECFEELLPQNLAPKKKLREYIETFMHLWQKNQWKRYKLAATFHVDEENLSPYSYFRFPILHS